jgi:hypothetical protein
MKLSLNIFNLSINLIVLWIFLIFNPLFAIFVTTGISLFTKRLNYLMVSILYALSFSLMFANQIYSGPSDIWSYVKMYESISSDHYTYSNIINIFFTIQLKHKDILWFFYLLFLGDLSNYNANIFVLSTYALIFSLSAILANLISDKGRYNPILILFSLVFIELSLLVHGYNQLRIIIGSLILLIGLVIYNPEKTKFFARVFIYSAGFIHFALFIYLIAFEVYALFIYKKDNLSKEVNYYLKVLLLIFAAILIFHILHLVIYSFAAKSPLTSNAYDLYLNPDMNNNKTFNISIYFNLMYLMIITYVVFNLKQLKSYEVFCIMAHIVLVVIQTTNNTFNIVFTRAALVPHLLFILISSKALYSDFFKGLSKWKSVYIFCFISLIFSIRIYKFNFNGLFFPLENVAQGAFLSPNYGLIYSLLYYDPVFL